MTTIQPSRPNLTSNDSAVLQALFDAESSPSAAVAIDPSLPAYPAHLNLDPEALESLRQRELSIVRTLQPSSSTPLTPQTIHAAIHSLDALIAEYPTYPSAHVNRAQALRTLIDQSKPEGDDDNESAFFSPQNTTPTTTLFDDLSRAIALATPLSPADPVSPTQARLLADAHTHRGYLLLKAARWRRANPNESGTGGPAKLAGMDAEQLEELASRDFFMGGRFGNQVAQQLAVQTNPYAKMCGAIVKEALREEMRGGGL
ncbi:hypothetical protein P170DRAFT_433080 [Aspergillus steynii IBT 23096]|uniref:Tetratricopeptide repeat protein 36 n=1 Tax=Aspergillus steynii IBT 23096 TaxID=1392250 RepID=A0A2I2GRQ1_9EURO|nr:uncharacterized protein P170DRAFT_433080 [Aspergillus steynii IBT 23096]PLB55562.1 hypothetical protein P170DRAFT_433080 [Aspergillus steynii IBT 23096]